MRLLYQLSIHVYVLLIRASALFMPKAAQWIRGRRGIFLQMESDLAGTKDRHTAWFHCASLGEFEQGRPVIEAFRGDHPDWRIILTFFSPSGYEIRKDYDKADHVYYLPADTLHNAKKFIKLAQPDLAVFIKYEFWFNYLHILAKQRIPVVFASVIFRKGQHFFRWWGGWFRNHLERIDRIFVQDESALELMQRCGLENGVISGDTRFDRVANIPEKAKRYEFLEDFYAGKPVFLAGSTWPQDEALVKGLYDHFNGKLKFIIAPHEIAPAHLKQLEALFGSDNILWFSQKKITSAEGHQVMIVDTIGHLSSLYQYATIAYIGGGFGAGIHNILEAATFGKPVIFGPHYQKFREARELLEKSGAFTINDREGLRQKVTELLEDPEVYDRAAEACRHYIDKNTGATEKIAGYLDALAKQLPG